MPRFTTEEFWGDFKPWGHGVRFFIAGDLTVWDDEMSYDVLARCVRTDQRFGFEDGQTIEEASSHSDAELWGDVIAPAIIDGRIEAYVWGERVEVTDE